MTTAAAPDVVLCDRCREPVYFVEGLRGPERWKHVKTHDHVCRPACALCGGEGRVQIGRWDVDGGQVPVFRLDHWECVACAAKNPDLRIDHT